ncbi:hypothetical protein C2857_006293 [Epichloe festucae Fl1]|uniref:Secreted protein n=1 Tax=Epichloe festucae (strain Fl1) TaxID=877507 RepID=A0A7S9KLH3_EPIFF|nr:hypothetical protein C2857_006293 [Epichloe festucae Fl1]
MNLFLLLLILAMAITATAMDTDTDVVLKFDVNTTAVFCSEKILGRCDAPLPGYLQCQTRNSTQSEKFSRTREQSIRFLFSVEGVEGVVSRQEGLLGKFGA